MFAVTSCVDTRRDCSLPFETWLMSSSVLLNLSAGIRNVSVAVDFPASRLRWSPPTNPPAPVASPTSSLAALLTSSTRTVMDPV